MVEYYTLIEAIGCVLVATEISMRFCTMYMYNYYYYYYYWYTYSIQ